MKYITLICLLLLCTQAAFLKTETSEDNLTVSAADDSLVADISQIDWVSAQTDVEKNLRSALIKFTLWDFITYIKKIYATYDLDGNGCLDFKEFYTMMNQLYPIDWVYFKRWVYWLFKRIDYDGNGCISPLEFLIWLLKILYP